MDSSLNLAPEGVVGELYLSGEQLARGYLSRPDLTAERFIPNPFSGSNSSSPYSRIYATGDLTRYRRDGTIEYIGRRDNQVKIRGFRIELGEVEEALRQRSDLVRDCKALVRTVGGTKHIVAYLLLHPKKNRRGLSQEEVSKDLREWAKLRLTNFMVPSYFVFLKRFPLFPNGKLNLKELPHPLAEDDVGRKRDTPVMHPQNALESKLHAIWSEALGNRQDISTTDNLFEIGGDSIVGIQIISKAVQIGLPIKVKDLFDYPTIRGLAKMLQDNSQKRKIVQSAKPQQGLVVGPSPMVCSQLWFLNRQSAHVDTQTLSHWNQAQIFEIGAPLTKKQFSEIARQLMEQHDALRSRFILSSETNQWSQYIEGLSALEGENFPLEYIDYTGQEKNSVSEEDVLRVQSSLNVVTGPVVRFVCMKFSESRHVVLIAGHHLVLDGVSWRILLEDFEKLFESKKLPEKTHSINFWSRRLTEYASTSPVCLPTRIRN